MTNELSRQLPITSKRGVYKAGSRSTHIPTLAVVETTCALNTISMLKHSSLYLLSCPIVHVIKIRQGRCLVLFSLLLLYFSARSLFI